MYAVGSAASKPERVYYSGLGDGSSWGANDWFDVPSQSTNEAGSTGDNITALAVDQDRLIIFKHDSIWSYDTYQLREITNSHGCVGKRAFANGENGIYFADNDGVYMLSGNTVMKMSDKIDTTWGEIPSSLIDNVCMKYFQGRLYVGCGQSGSTYNDMILVNYTHLPRDEEGQTPWTRWVGTADDPMCPTVIDVYYESPTTAPALYYGCANAQSILIQFDTGTTDYDFSAGTATAAIESNYYTKVFNIPAFYRKQFITHKVQSAADSKITVDTIVDFGMTSFSYDYAMTVDGDVYGTGVYGAAVYGGQDALIGSNSVSLKGKFVQFSITNNKASEPFTLYRIQQIYKPVQLR